MRWCAIVALGCTFVGCHGSPVGQHKDAALGSGDQAAGGGDADPSTPEGFCRGYFALVADVLTRCDGVPAATAQALLAVPLQCQHVTASIAAGRTSFDPTHAAACLSELKALFTCEGTSSMPPPLMDCDVLKPLVPVGGTCRSIYLINLALECQDNSFCQEGPNYACTGTCTARAPLGTPCDPLDFNVRCVSGASCDSTTNVCAATPAAAAVDQPCGGAPTVSCARGLYCDTTGADGGSSGVCHPKKTSGPCRSDGECVSSSYCAGASGAKTCTTPKTAGQTCVPGQRECVLGAYCGSGHTCVDSLAAVGQPCGSVGGESISCAPDLHCDATTLGSGICQPDKTPGEACSGSSLVECGGDNGHCDATTHKCVACQ